MRRSAKSENEKCKLEKLDWQVRIDEVAIRSSMSQLVHEQTRSTSWQLMWLSKKTDLFMVATVSNSTPRKLVCNTKSKQQLVLGKTTDALRGAVKLVQDELLQVFSSSDDAINAAIALCQPSVQTAAEQNCPLLLLRARVKPGLVYISPTASGYTLAVASLRPIDVVRTLDSTH